MGAPSSRAVALGAAFLLLLVALPSAFLYLTSSAAPVASRAALLNLKPFSARCPPAAAPPLRVFMYDLPPRFHVAMMTTADNGPNGTAAGFPAWPPSAGGIRRQHSVEYWMMASLQDWGGGGGVGSERREAVRVRDPDAAEAFFVPFFSSLSFNVHGRNMTDPETEADRLLQVEFPGLAELLSKVATEDRTVLMTSVNEIWTRPNSLLDIFLGGFRNGEDIAHLVNHVLIVTVDAGSLNGCKAVHPHCYLLEVKSMDMNRAKTFGTREYVEMIWLKLSIQQRVLELGYNFLFTDADILWLRNPFQHISVYADMSCSLDNSKMAPAPLDCENNVGFYYMKSTNRSIEMIKYWRAARARFEGNPMEQVVFNKIKYELISELGARIQPLETEYISGFCDFQERLDRVCTVHANCCMGLENKVNDLRNVAADWKNYTSLPPEVRKKVGVKVTAPSMCRKSMGWT